jgi:histidinol-phosphate aminotransferase
LGICYIAAIISVLNKIKPPYNVNEQQQRALERLADKENKLEMTQLYKYIYLKYYMKLILYLKFIRQANFVLIKVDNANRRYDQLIARNRY